MHNTTGVENARHGKCDTKMHTVYVAQLALALHNACRFSFQSDILPDHKNNYCLNV